MKFLLITLSALLLIPNFINVHLADIPKYNSKEKFDPSLSYINSTEKLIKVSDSIARFKNIPENSFEYALTVTQLLRKRFYHGYSRYSLNENWLAASGEYMFGYGLGSIVNSDDILKYKFAACSQQAIVLTEVMKAKKIPFRSVGFPHHYATELKFNNYWYYFDPNGEPNIPDSARLETKWHYNIQNLKKYYDTGNYQNLDWIFGFSSPVFGEVNAKAAPRAELFHTTTKYLSKTLWLFPLFFLFLRRKKETGIRTNLANT